MGVSVRFQPVLGIRFAADHAQAAVDEVCLRGGLVVMPSGPALLLLAMDANYREAVSGADLALPDSALMVLVWNLTHRSRIGKLSGLKYLRALIQRPEFMQPGTSFWVMPNSSAATRNVRWLSHQSVNLAKQDIYIAPMYSQTMKDAELLRRIELTRPRHVILGLAGGTQERLGMYLKHNLSYSPAIHCIGAAIAFLSGAQVCIPVWVDQLGLGWLWRTASDPVAYAPRYWAARRLATMILRHGEQMPSLSAVVVAPPNALPAAPSER